MRINKTDYYLNIAKAVSLRSTCLRRQYGTVIVKNDRIISTGYNGSPRGAENCCDSGKCWRQENNIPQGQQYEKCQAVHAEQNAIIFSNGQDLIDSEIYIYGFDVEKNKEIEAKPCLICEKMIANSGIKKVILRKENL